MTLALHLCRGNFRSRWVFEGALDPVAEQLFQLPYDVFLIEWEDSAREGDFGALRFLPRGGPKWLSISRTPAAPACSMSRRLGIFRSSMAARSSARISAAVTSSMFCPDYP